MNRPEWQFPSRIYSDYRQYNIGDRVDLDRLHDELVLHGFESVAVNKMIGKHENHVNDCHFSIFSDKIYLDIPPFDYNDDYGNFGHLVIMLDKRMRISDIHNADGKALESFRLPPVMMGRFIDHNLILRTYMPLDSMGENIVNAVVSAEDRHFYRHFGINPLSMFRATQRNIGELGIIQGGSTITQQLVKNLYFTPKRTISRKLREIVGSFYLETHLPKKTILEWYLNMVYVGYKFPYNICGIAEGSRFYFDKEPDELGIEEAALIAGLIPAPSYFNPYKYPDRVKKRRNHILNAMHEEGYISDTEFERAQKAPVKVKNGIEISNKYRDFRDYLERYATKNHLDTLLYFSGGKVFTTVDPYMQSSAEKALVKGIEHVDSLWRSKDAQGAIVTIDNFNGHVKAIIGGRKDEKNLFNRALQAKRQPGSSFKIFVYLAAMDAPLSDDSLYITPGTMLPDTLSTFFVEDSLDSIWRPKNYGGEYMGIVPVRRAFERSQNIATTYLTMKLSSERVARYAYRMGIQSDVGHKASIGLGAAEVTPFEMARAVSTIASYGQKREVMPIKSIIDRDGAIDYLSNSTIEQVIDSTSCFLLIHLLDGVVRYGRSYDVREIGFKYPSYGKTGTSNNERDAWYVGFTKDYTSCVWIGYDDARTTGLTGTQAALPVWTYLNKDIHKGLKRKAFQPAKGLEMAWICHDSGKLPGKHCRMQIKEYYLPGTAPKTACDWTHDEVE